MQLVANIMLCLWLPNYWPRAPTIISKVAYLPVNVQMTLGASG